MNLREEYKRKIDALASATFNRDQKDLAKRMLDAAPDKELTQWYQLIIQKVKTGFKFDAAPEVAQNSVAILVEDVDKRINVTDLPNNDENVLIIGENYDALKNLLVTHKNKIDIIYIDPPYNTEKTLEDGNNLGSDAHISANKFVYRDKFSRTGWLNMMNERLLMAKQLLSNEGVIFISIDDTEQAYLKVLMDEIFGEENFVASAMVENNPKGRKNGTFFAVSSEYLLIYVKDISKWGRDVREFNGRLDPEKKILVDENGVKYTRGKRQLIGINSNPIATKDNFERSFHIFINKSTREFVFINTLNSDGSINLNLSHNIKDAIHYEPRNKETNEFNVVTYTKEKMKDLIENNMLLLFENFIYEKEQNFDSKYKNIFTKETTYGVDLKTETAGIELESILGNKIFAMPKNPDFIKMILNLVPNKNATILDFFAGSGTTAHSVLKLNQQDSGKRKFILCTNNENKIGEKITYERLHRIMKGHGTKGETDFKWLKENSAFTHSNLRVFSIEHHPCSINDDISDIEVKAKSSFTKLDHAYDDKSEIDIYYDLNSLHPQKDEK